MKNIIINDLDVWSLIFLCYIIWLQKLSILLYVCSIIERNYTTCQF